MTDPRSCSCGELHQIPTGWSVYRCSSCGVVYAVLYPANFYHPAMWHVVEAKYIVFSEEGA